MAGAKEKNPVNMVERGRKGHVGVREGGFRGIGSVLFPDLCWLLVDFFV